MRKSIFIPASAIILFFVLLLSCLTVSSDPNLISSTCKHTPNYNLCVQYLNSDPRSSTAKDVTGLALTMVDILKAKTITTIGHIKQIFVRNPNNPKLKKLLRECTEGYGVVLTADIPEAIEALQKGDPKFAEDGVADAAIEAEGCEESFNGKSPLTSFNKVVHDVAEIARQMVRLLL